jgi:hypothetical protein
VFGYKLHFDSLFVSLQGFGILRELVTFQNLNQSILVVLSINGLFGSCPFVLVSFGGSRTFRFSIHLCTTTTDDAV